MICWLTDENLDGRLVKGLRAARPLLDVVRFQEAGLRTRPDDEVLAWAARNDRVPITIDRATIRDAAYKRVARGLAMPGVAVLRKRLLVTAAIDEILIADGASFPEDWDGRVIYLPY